MASQRELVEQLFETALALDPTERQAHLDQVCGGDSQLRRMVEELLAEDAHAGSFLRHPPFDFLGKAAESLHPYSEETRTANGNGTPSDTAPAGRLEPGQTLIDRFLIVRFIAKGGMGEVYEAADYFLQSDHVALKIIRPHIAGDPDSRLRFEREVLLARKVTHPNLCPIYDIFHCEQPPPGFLFLTMKLLPGETLAARLHRSGPIPVEEGLVILKQVAAGLAAIHDSGIVHRDIKPNNILLDGIGKDVRLYITDFGLARAYESDITISIEGVVTGTPGYIAPELLLGHPPSQASDLFALGVVLHEIFTGEKPVVAPASSAAIVSARLGTSGAPSFCVQLIRECLSGEPQRRCDAFERALDSLNLNRQPRILWTRRRLVGTAAAAVCAAAGGAWWKRANFEDLLDPLPRKRFIALLNWPKTSDSHVAPMLTGALSAIKSELSRVEAFDRNLFVISPEDVGGGDLARAGQLREVCDPLGANLVLAASGLPDSKNFRLSLRLLDPVSGRSLRERKLTCALADITSLPGRAVQAAASLLHLSGHLRDDKQMDGGTQSVSAFTAFQSAEALMKQPNDTGLSEAIEKYKQAVDLDPNYAIAHAKLALAYGRFYFIRRDPGALNLARGNCEHALTLDPNLVDARLARASLFEQTGNVQGALDEVTKTLALDPSNPRTLLWQARIYTRLNRWADAEQTFHRLLQERPNYWVTYNDLGFALHAEGKHQEAIQAFAAASVAAPGSSLALSNLGIEYLQFGDFARATESLKKSLALRPNAEAAAGASLALRCQSKFEEALPFALKAVELNPADDTNWLELGECYSSLRNRQREAKSAYLRAAKEAERHLRIDAADGPGWMLLALYRVKSGKPQDAASFMERAESLGAADMDSQLSKARILELLGRREEALATLAVCFRKGATALEVESFPEMQSLRKDPRYREVLQTKSTVADKN